MSSIIMISEMDIPAVTKFVDKLRIASDRGYLNKTSHNFVVDDLRFVTEIFEVNSDRNVTGNTLALEWDTKQQQFSINAYRGSCDFSKWCSGDTVQNPSSVSNRWVSSYSAFDLGTPYNWPIHSFTECHELRVPKSYDLQFHDSTVTANGIRIRTFKIWYSYRV